MLTARAISSIEWLFEKSIHDNSVFSPTDRCVVTSLSEKAPAIDDDKHLVLINISSYAFRIVALFSFNNNAATAAHFSKISHNTDKTLCDQLLLDTYSELVNLICGAVNQRLRNEFRHVALSTPFVLAISCVQYISMLNFSMTRSINVVINESVDFNVIVGVCVDNNTVLDFDIDRAEQQDISCGEIELF